MAKKLKYEDLYTLRKDGRYQGYYKDADGVRHALCDKDPQKLYERLQDKEKPKKPTFGEIAEEWKEEHWKKIGVGTQYAYKAPFEQMVSEHGTFNVEDVTAAEINKVMLREKNKDYSYKHASTLRTMYKQTFNYAIINGYTTDNPALVVNVPRGMKKTTRNAPENDIIQVIKDNVDKPFGLFPYFLIYTGFRAGEAVGITWGDIDFKNKTITCKRSVELHTSVPEIKDPKSKAGFRTVPLLDDLEKVLIKPDGAKLDDYVFNKDGKLLTRSALRSRWISWCRSVGLAKPVTVTRKHSKKNIEYKATEWRPTLTAHQLRHGYATILYEAGIDELTAMELMGHADIETTRRIYTHLRQSKRAGVADILNKQFAALDGKADVKNQNNADNTTF